jgi:hypothetical protein
MNSPADRLKMPSFQSYHLVEPFPPAPASPSTASAQPESPTSRSNHRFGLKKRNNPFAAGRGGAGNVHHHSEWAIFFFDEELERQLAEQKHLAPVYHVGRGGACNMVYLDGPVRRKGSTSEGSDNRASSEESGADTAARNIKKHWRWQLYD